MAELRDLVNRARAGRLRSSELTDATITVTNLGDQGVESVTGVIYPPQVALVGFGKVAERPWAVGGLLGVRPVVDHHARRRPPRDRRLHRRPVPHRPRGTAATTGGAVTPEQARQTIKDILREVAPDADPDTLPDDADLRDSLELDSLDFLNFVEELAQRSGQRIDEDDYPQARHPGERSHVPGRIVTQARDFLDRFRPAGAPGSAARVGVPADRARELAAEVEPVLVLLDEAHAECERIIEAGRQEAGRIAAETHAELARIGQEADRNARAARDEAAAEVLAQARAEVQETAAEADQQALRIRRLARRRRPELVAAAAGLVRAGPGGHLAPAARQDMAAGQDAAAGQDVTAGPPS